MRQTKPEQSKLFRPKVPHTYGLPRCFSTVLWIVPHTVFDWSALCKGCAIPEVKRKPPIRRDEKRMKR
jgi:hypothetical protein